MVTMSPCDDLIRTYLKVHVCVKVIGIACQPAAINFEPLCRAARESPPSIFTPVIMVAINSSNILITATHEVHWLVKMVNIICECTLGISTEFEVLAVPAPSSVSCAAIVNALHLVHSSTFVATYVEWLIIIILVLTFSKEVFQTLRSSVCEGKAHKE